MYQWLLFTEKRLLPDPVAAGNFVEIYPESGPSKWRILSGRIR